MSIEVLPLSSANADLLDNIASEVFDNPIQSRYLAAFLTDPRHIMCLAVDDGVVVGMASAVEYFHPDKAGQLWINEVGVASTHRCRGIGRALVSWMIDTAQTRECVCAWLGTDTDNAAGQACFAAVPEGEAPQPFLLYEWDLDD